MLKKFMNFNIYYNKLMRTNIKFFVMKKNNKIIEKYNEEYENQKIVSPCFSSVIVILNLIKLIDNKSF